MAERIVLGVLFFMFVVVISVISSGLKNVETRRRTYDRHWVNFDGKRGVETTDYVEYRRKDGSWENKLSSFWHSGDFILVSFLLFAILFVSVLAFFHGA